MLLNHNTVLCSGKLSLVPYLTSHVKRYHEWMQNAELQGLTASEPLSLAQEFEMQKSWSQDPLKLTFILHYHFQEIDEFDETSKFGKMIGDVNLYFNVPDEEFQAELEVMIAEPNARRMGLGSLACKIMMDYAVKKLFVSRFVVKIGMDNLPSLRMFEGLGFVSQSTSQIFREETLSISSNAVGPIDYSTHNLTEP